MNAVVTTFCNQSCDFCFAKELLSDPEPVREMRLETAQNLSLFLKRSRIPRINILGGEPTLHPHLDAILEIFHRQRIEITLLTNAVCDPSRFGALLPKIDHVLINLRDPFDYKDSESNHICNNLNILASERKKREKQNRALGIDLGITFTTVGQNYHYLMEWGRYYEVRSLRWDLSKPSPSGKNRYLVPWEHPGLGNWLTEFVATAKEKGLQTGLDCPVPFCIFSPDQLSFMKMHVFSFRGICRPPMDVLPDGKILHCFPLAGFCDPPHLSNLENHQELIRFMTIFVRKWAFYQEIRNRCGKCGWHRTGQCQGYCPSIPLRNAAKDDGCLQKTG